MKRFFSIFILALFACYVAAQNVDSKNALMNYVQTPDASYHWEEMVGRRIVCSLPLKPGGILSGYTNWL